MTETEVDFKKLCENIMLMIDEFDTFNNNVIPAEIDVILQTIYQEAEEAIFQAVDKV